MNDPTAVPATQTAEPVSSPEQWTTDPISFTIGQLAEAFTEWERRYREEPDRFESEAKRLLTRTPESYGEACAPYLVGLLTGAV